MSLENAKENLKEFGKELGLEGLDFDENNTCILGIDDEFSMHMTYEPNSKRLYIYSPLLDGLPKDSKIRLRLYEKLLEGSMLGGQMAGGGVGVASKEELVLLHCVLDMEHAAAQALRAFAPLYVETVEKWRKLVKAIMEGKEVEVPRTAGPGIGPGGVGPGGQPPAGGQQSPPAGGGGAPGGGFIKI